MMVEGNGRWEKNEMIVVRGGIGKGEKEVDLTFSEGTATGVRPYAVGAVMPIRVVGGEGEALLPACRSKGF